MDSSLIYWRLNLDLFFALMTLLEFVKFLNKDSKMIVVVEWSNNSRSLTFSAGSRTASVHFLSPWSFSSPFSTEQGNPCHCTGIVILSLIWLVTSPFSNAHWCPCHLNIYFILNPLSWLSHIWCISKIPSSTTPPTPKYSHHFWMKGLLSSKLKVHDLYYL